MNLSARRCFNHVAREAVACCPECQRFFCRECISEHQGRVVCAGCLDALTATVAVKSSWGGGLFCLGMVLTGLFTGWIWFYYLGSFLLFLPSSFHEGTLWH
jgi:hypothetical protein